MLGGRQVGRWSRASCAAQFRYIKIQPKTIGLITRLWEINPTNSVVIPRCLALSSIVLGWILIYQNWSILSQWCLLHHVLNYVLHHMRLNVWATVRCCNLSSLTSQLWIVTCSCPIQPVQVERGRKSHTGVVQDGNAKLHDRHSCSDSDTLSKCEHFSYNCCWYGRSLLWCTHAVCCWYAKNAGIPSVTDVGCLTPWRVDVNIT